MQKRKRSKPHDFRENIAAEIERCKEELAARPPGRARDALVAKIRQLETAIHMDEWLRSPELKPPS